jgi:hypothetical protein
MTPQGLWERFQGRWGGSLIGYELRASHAARWLRVHSLPGSKRYPETPAEEALLLERHQALLSWALAGESRFALSSVETERSWPEEREVELGPRDLVHSARDENGTHRRTFLSVRGFDATAYDGVLLGIATEKLWGVAFCDLAFTTVVAPYDGGVDLFFTAPARLEEARTRFAAWRSSRADGL